MMMTTQTAIEDAFVFFALILALNNYIQVRLLRDSETGNPKTNSSVWRFRCFSIILLIYLMLIGILHQMGFVATGFAIALWAIVMIPVVMGRNWLFSKLNRK